MVDLSIATLNYQRVRILKAEVWTFDPWNLGVLQDAAPKLHGLKAPIATRVRDLINL